MTLKSLLQLNEDLEMLITGIVYSCLTLPLFPLFFLLMKAITLKNRSSSNVTLKLMNIINSLQLIQTFCHFVSGPIIVFPVLHEELHWVIGVVGCILNIGWVGEFPIIALLAICRILIFSNKIDLRKMPIFVKRILAVLALWTVFIFVFGSYSQFVILATPSWGFNYSLPVMAFFDAQELFISFTCLPLTYVAYMFMAYLIYTKKNISSYAYSRKNEIMILVQSTFITFYVTVLITIWHQPLLRITLVDMSVRRNQAIVNGCVIMHCYVNPSLTLVFNKSIREEFLRLLGWKKMGQKSRSFAKASVISSQRS